jgi:DNA-directed RNA polymerase specialized sigma24 family protein
MTHPLNKKISTISTADIYNEAYLAVKLFIGKKSQHTTLPAFGSHVSLEDLAMDTCEKVVRANPIYLTKTYVRIAARCVCLDKLKSRKLRQVHVDPFEDEVVVLEDCVEGDITDKIDILEQQLLSAMDPLQKRIYEELLKNKMYVEISETLNISLRTLERQIQELKWLCEYLLVGTDPDTNKHSLLF